MSDEPRCPECGTVVHEGWDWCHGCGYDPDHLRPTAAAPQPAPSPPPQPAPSPVPSPGPPAAPSPAMTPLTPLTPQGWVPAPASPPAAPSRAPGPAAPPPSSLTAPGWVPAGAQGGPGGPQLPPPIGQAPRPTGQPRSSPPVGLLVAGGVAIVILLVVAVAIVIRPKDAAIVASQDATTTSTAAPAGPTTAAGAGAGAGADAPGAPPAGMFEKPASGSEVIDKATAKKVLDAFWPVHLDGWKRHDPATVARVETGAAKDWDSVACVGGCSATYDKVLDATFTAPPQSSYPASFLAQLHLSVSGVDTKGRPLSGIDTELVVFTRASAEAPWLAALIAGFADAEPVVPANATSTMIARPPAVTGPIDPHDLPTRLAEYFDSYAQTGAAPPHTPLHDNGAPAEQARTNVELQGKMAAQGVKNEITYRSGADEDGYYAFASGPDAVLACSTIRWTATATSVIAGGSITVKAGDLFPAVVPPGAYTRIERDGVRQACFRLSYDCSCLTVSGLDGGTYVARTEPA